MPMPRAPGALCPSCTDAGGMTCRASRAPGWRQPARQAASGPGVSGVRQNTGMPAVAPPCSRVTESGRWHERAFRRGLLRGAGLLVLLWLGGCGARIASPAGPPRGQALLLRGIADLSTGMDELAGRLAEAGYLAEVHNHLAGHELAERCIAEARAGRLLRPLAVIGHSLGADAALALAGALGAAGVETDLVVTFDPVWTGAVPPGPRRVLNVFQGADVWGRPLSPAPGFAGRLDNVDLRGLRGVHHFNMDKDPALHAEVLAALAAVTPRR